MVGIDKDLIELVQSENLAELVGIFDLSGRKDALGVPVLGGDADWDAWRAVNPGSPSSCPSTRRSAAARWPHVYGLDRCLTIVSKRSARRAFRKARTGEHRAERRACCRQMP